VNGAQRAEGYRLIASFPDGDREPAAVAGFRVRHTLYAGYMLYVDDLVTREARRGEGHADALMRWLLEEAARLGCDQLHLDSGVQRERRPPTASISTTGCASALTTSHVNWTARNSRQLICKARRRVVCSRRRRTRPLTRRQPMKARMSAPTSTNPQRSTTLCSISNSAPRK
jgi:GNAT superfamily N-acetyltransferase